MGGIDDARNLSHEEFLVVSATIEYQETIAQLREQAASLYENPPFEAEHDGGASELEWQESLGEIESQLQTEADCWYYPLDHPKGERLLNDAPHGGAALQDAGEARLRPYEEARA